PMDRHELRQIMCTWPILMRQATDDKVKKFAYYVWERSSEAAWLPTLKQGQWIRELHREISEQDDAPDLIED
ncbi:MAG: hypothetical protein L7V15_04200, partial [Burkholderiales bacterium]|nr:hypothetical protein [Burkholderiales bacterium]